MSQKTTGALYQTWNDSWRPRANRRQVALTFVLSLAAPAVVIIHWLTVVSPQLAIDFARLERPYQPWYLTRQPSGFTKEVGPVSPAKATAEVAVHGTTAASRDFLTSRPNLVPGSQDWDATRLREAVLGLLDEKARDRGKNAYTSSPEWTAVAQDLAERYAAGGAEALQGEYETSLLAGGWLWEVRRGCEASAYSSFPSRMIEQMGCGLEVMPEARALGLGVARWSAPNGQVVPVISLVWRGGAGERGGN